MRRVRTGQITVGVVVGLSLAACVGDNGAVTTASLGVDAMPPAGAAAPAQAVSLGPLLEGPMGSKLAEADRQSAFVAETQALSSGDRRTWRGSKGVFGFVVPGGAAASSLAVTGSGECRTFTHTIYFAGRPQTGTGTGCRDPDGSWRIVG